MNLFDYTYVYFLGIGGIGMSALARWFKMQGFEVAGYDKTETPLTQQLQTEGIDIHYDRQSGRIPRAFYDKSKTLVVRTPAVPTDHIEYQYFNSEQYTILKRAEVLGLITESLQTIGVAGTHGKTTTSTLVAHLILASGQSVNAFLGGISANHQSNLLTGTRNDWCVVEADEYDRSFLTLQPTMAIITSADADHLDIYGSHEAVLESFNAYIQKIKPQGFLVIKEGLPLSIPSHLKAKTYGSPSADVFADHVRVENGIFVFDYCAATLRIENLKMGTPGYHNIENALAAITIALELGIAEEAIRAGIESFRGAKRRFDFIARSESFVQIDDYAHHPAEVEALLNSVRGLYPNKRITCAFQPHLYSRTQDFATEFAKALSIADEVMVLDIYPARELPIAGVTAQLISERVQAKRVVQIHKDELVATVQQWRPEVMITLGAGDIDTCIEPIHQTLMQTVQP